MPGGNKKGGGLKVKSAYKSYTPYKMKAAAHNNSPIEKNYGSPAQRGFDFTGGVGSKEMEGGVGSAFDYASPAKGWFSDMAKKAGGAIKGIGGGIGSAIGSIKDKVAEAKAAKAAAAGGGGGMAAIAQKAQAVGGVGGGEVPQHGAESHSGESVNPAKQGGAWGGDVKALAQGAMGGQQAQMLTKQQALDKNQAMADMVNQG